MKSCIIIGFGAGISAAVARRFAGEGYALGLVARNETRLAEHAQSLLAAGFRVETATADAGVEQALDTALSTLLGKLGRCDVLVYNASVMRPGDPLDLTSDEIGREFSVNLLGAHRAVRMLAPGMIDRGSGAILMTGGGLALEPYPEWTSLALGKAALRSYAISLYKALKPKGVHVCVLAVCGIVEKKGAFDPDLIAQQYFRVATEPRGVEDREVILQPHGTDPYYNDPDRRHAATTVAPAHVAEADGP